MAEENTSFRVSDPSVTSSDYDYMQSYWQMHDDVLGGTRTMREAGAKYLHKHEAETQAAWEMRRDRTTLFNVLADSIENIVSRPFAKPLVIGEKAHKKIVDWKDNIDTRGTSLHNFMGGIFEGAINYGPGHILVEYPRKIEGMTLADARRAGHRPYFINLPAQNVIGIYHERLNGREICSHLRFEERSIRLNRSNLSEEEVITIKIIEPDLFHTYERVVTVKTANGMERRDTNWKLIDSGPYTFGEVPVATLKIGKDMGGMRMKPAFTDLAYKNIEHWQGGSDQRHILTRARFAMLAASGIDSDDMKKNDDGIPMMEWGPDSLLVTADAQGRFYFVEAKGTAIESGRLDQADMVEQMRVMGIDPLMPKISGDITATQSSIDESKSQSRLHKWTHSAQDTCDKALGFAAKWEGIPEEQVNVETGLNTEFGIIGSAEDIKMLMEMRRDREIDKQTFFSELKRRGFFNDKINIDDVQDQLDSEPPDFAVDTKRKVKNVPIKKAS